MYLGTFFSFLYHCVSLILELFFLNIHLTNRKKIQHVSLSKLYVYICFDINDCQSKKHCQCDAQSGDCVGGLMLYR